MSVNVNRELLNKALSMCVPVLPSDVKNTLPILKGALLSLKDDMLWIATTNLDVSVKTGVQAGSHVAEDFRTVINAKTFGKAARLLRSPILTLTNGEMFTVSSPNNSLDFITIPADDFPPLQDGGNKTRIEIDAKEFLRCAQTAIAFTGESFGSAVCSVQIELTGEKRERKLRFRSTNTHQLYEGAMSIKATVGNIPVVCIPSECLKIVVKALAVAKPYEMSIVYGDAQIRFEFDATVISSRLDTRQFPNVGKLLGPLLTRKNTHEIVFKRQNLLHSLREGMALVTGSDRVYFKAESKHIELYFTSDRSFSGLNESRYKTTVHEVNTKIEPFLTDYQLMAANVEYLITVLKSSKSEYMIMDVLYEGNTSMRPILFHDYDFTTKIRSSDAVFIVMPMQSSDTKVAW